MKLSAQSFSVAPRAVVFSQGVLAKEYPPGAPVEHEGMQIALSYLLNIETSPPPDNYI